MPYPLITMAFLTGLLGSGHCVGMCGGIVAALALAGKQQGNVAFHLLYNSGRLVTYTMIGLLAGLLGSALAYTREFAWFTRTALVVADGFVILIGLATLTSWSALAVSRLEQGIPATMLSRLVARLVRLPGCWPALPLGLLMGFLPCGFLYAMVITAAQSAQPLAGALTMLAFGMGTLPALLFFGTVAGWLGQRARGIMLRAAGGVVLLMGLYNLYRHLRIFDWIMAAVPFRWLCCP